VLRPVRRAEFLAESPERGRVAVIAVREPQQRRKVTEAGLIERPVVRQAVARPLYELLDCPSSARDADERHAEITAPHETRPA
jgi:hypothetical protein